MRRIVIRSRLQLLGVSALFIACKYQEIYPPVLSDLVHMTQNAYTNDQVLEMEA
jgi:cyclin B